jgi:hypothetical protein
LSTTTTICDIAAKIPGSIIFEQIFLCMGSKQFWAKAGNNCRGKAGNKFGFQIQGNLQVGTE